MNINWNILQINAKFHGVFHSKPMIAYKRSRNLQEIIGGHAVTQGSVHRQNGKFLPCSLTRPSQWCAQIVNTRMFITSQQTKKTFNIFCKLTYKSKYAIYFIECTLRKI